MSLLAEGYYFESHAMKYKCRMRASLSDSVTFVYSHELYVERQTTVPLGPILSKMDVPALQKMFPTCTFYHHLCHAVATRD